MDSLHLLWALLGVVVLLLSLGAQLLRRHAFLPSELMLATGVGVLVGPHGADVLGVATWAPPMELIEAVARVTVAIAVMSIALTLPADYVRSRWRSLALLLGPGMVLMWLASSALTYWLVPVSTAMALLVGAIVTPTDPVIANSIVQGPTAEGTVPERVRRVLMAEAGANDGVAYAFVFLAIYLLGHASEGSLFTWGVSTGGWAIGGALALGLLIGAGAGRVERLLSHRELLDETSVFTVTIALTFAVLGVTSLLGTDDVLAVFVAGLAYNWQADPSDESREQSVEEVFNRAFTLPVFVAFGAVLPWSEWASLGWRAVALVCGVLLLRRLPMVFLLWRGIDPLETRADALFVGWFGPIGVAAMLYATVAVRETGARTPWILGSLIVAGSILAHGMTATAATHWYGTRGDQASASA